MSERTLYEITQDCIAEMRRQRDRADRAEEIANDLFAALKAMVSEHDTLTELRFGQPPALTNRTLDAARAAIAKATHSIEENN